MKQKTLCVNCNKEFFNVGYAIHIKTCKQKQEKLNNIVGIKLDENLYECPHCNKTFTKCGIGTHIWRKHTEEGLKFDPNKCIKEGRGIIWNKGLTKETDERVLNYSLTYTKNYELGLITNYMKGKHHSDESKKKISDGHISFLKENPDKVPYLLNHYSKGESYPEKYFRELFEKLNIEFKQEVRVGLYSLDFVIGNLNLEIDGEQHYVDNRISESDLKRNKFIEESGYIVKRIRWKEYQKCTYEERELIVNDILSHVTN